MNQHESSSGNGPANEAGRGASVGQDAHGSAASHVARLAALVGVVLLAASSLPYLVNYATCPRDQVFTGLIEWLPDQLSYIAWMRQVAEGGPVYDLYTPEPHPPFRAPAFWAWLGAAAGRLGLGLIATYHIARTLLAAAYLLALWQALKVWVPEAAHRLIAFTAIAGGSGLGFLAAPLGVAHLAADIHMPELWSFSSFLYYPHFAASLSLMAGAWWALGMLWLARKADWWRPAATLAACAILLAFVHPYTWFPMAGAVLLYAVLYGRRDGVPVLRLWLGPVAALMGAPIIACQALAAQAHPILRQWMQQNVLPSPSPLAYLVGFGLAPVMAIAALAWRDRARARNPLRNFAFAWVIAAFLMAYSYPLLPFARRCVEGAHVFLVLLGLPAWAAVAERLSRKLTGRALNKFSHRAHFATSLACVATALLLWPTTVYVVTLECVRSTGRVNVAVRDMWQTIEREVAPHVPIFCNASDGMYLPAMTGRRVWVGHFHLTTNFARRRDTAERFFRADTPNASRAALLAHSGCGYVFLGDCSPKLKLQLDALLGRPVLQRDSALLYCVRTRMIPPRALGGAHEQSFLPVLPKLFQRSLCSSIGQFLLHLHCAATQVRLRDRFVPVQRHGAACGFLMPAAKAGFAKKQTEKSCAVIADMAQRCYNASTRGVAPLEFQGGARDAQGIYVN